MDDIISQVPDASAWKMTPAQFQRYKNLDNQKTEKLARLCEFMLNDGEI